MQRQTNSTKEKYPIKMIALDLDGTTFNSAAQLSNRNKEVIEEAIRRGVEVIISTGRAFTSLPDSIKDIEGIKYAITSNGAHIIDLSTGESIYSEYLSETAVRQVSDLTDKLDIQLEIFFEGQAYIDEEYFNYIKEHGCAYRNTAYVLWSRKPVHDIKAFMIDNISRIDNINICFYSLEALELARGQVEAINEASITSSFKNNLEVGGPDTTKKNALVRLMDILGISRDELMACGDAPNDIQMIEYAKLGIAMGNAWGGTKEYADYVTGTNDEDGVAIAIEKFVL
ncbi:MAG: HAD family phosphatase [Clostridiales bacterium]|nr:HAD family phosphatase [Clostridiales bacterium]